MRFYAQLCGWRPERIAAGGESYLALEMGNEIGGGIVECATAGRSGCPTSRFPRSRKRPSGLGTSAPVVLEPREGPAGWRSVVAAPAGGEIAFWQPKRLAERRTGRSSQMRPMSFRLADPGL